MNPAPGAPRAVSQVSQVGRSMAFTIDMAHMHLIDPESENVV